MTTEITAPALPFMSDASEVRRRMSTTSVEGLPALGEIVAERYRVIDVIGAGGMGVVVSAERLLLGDRVALKFMRPCLASDALQVRRFMREARAMARLRGGHAIRVFDIDRLPNGAPFLVMEYLAGRTVGDALRERGAHPFARALDYTHQACLALAEVHAAGFVHRDVKPTNLFLVARHGREMVKLLDFGLVKLLAPNVDADDLATATGCPIGSPRYMAPEQIGASDSVDARADVWSLGATLYELLAGRPAFEGKDILAIFTAVSRGSYRPLRDVAPWVPPRIDPVIERCLSLESEKRYADAAALGAALDEVARDLAITFRRYAEWIPSGAELVDPFGATRRGIPIPERTLRITAASR